MLYALGGGMGHLVRATSITRAIKRISGFDPIILTTPGFTDIVKNEAVRLQVVAEPDEPKEYRGKIIEKLKKLDPDVLIVDALPMGLMGELRDFLPGFTGPKILVARMLREDYRLQMGIDEFVGEEYDMVVRAEKMPDNHLKHDNSVHAPNILVRSADEIPGRQRARDMLKVPRERFLVVALSTHQPLRADAFFQMVFRSLMKIGEKRAVIKFVSPYGEPDPSSAHTSYFPMMELMPGIDALVGHGGYHLIHEAETLRVPFLVFPQEKLYDDQHARLSDRKSDYLIEFKSNMEMENGLRKMLGRSRGKRKIPKFENGADTAAEAIVEFCKNTIGADKAR